MKDLVIFGAGDFGREIANVVERINQENKTWNLVGFVDDNRDIQGSTVDGYPVVGDTKWLNNYAKEIYAICSLGIAKIRQREIDKITNSKVKYATLIDPDARVYKDAEVDEGSIVCGGSVLAINTKVGKHVIINLNCSVGHDSIVENFCVLNPGVNLSGKVLACESTDLGTGSKVLQGVNISPNTVIGAGAVVLKDITESGTYVGVPVKRVK